MKAKAFSLWFSSLLILSLMVGCSQSGTGGDLVGTWRADDGEIVQFGKDGSYSMKTASTSAAPGEPAATTGTYTKTTNTRVVVETKGPERTSSATYEFSVSGDKLVLQAVGTPITRTYRRAAN